jgi:hypothetical protein
MRLGRELILLGKFIEVITGHIKIPPTDASISWHEGLRTEKSYPFADNW